MALTLSVLAVSPVGAQDDPFPDPHLLMPFPAGTGTVGTAYGGNAFHQDSNLYSLDLCEADGCAIGDKVLAPTDLTLAGSYDVNHTAGGPDYHIFTVAQSGADSLCLALGHFALTAQPDANSIYRRGTELGPLVDYRYVDETSTSDPHIHVGLWTVADNDICDVRVVDDTERTAVPFVGKYALDVRDGVRQEFRSGENHKGKTATSTNGAGSTGSSTAKPPSDKPPLSRPVELPARVPWSAGQAQSLISSYEPAAPEGFGLTFAGANSDAVFPVYPGAVVFAGCASGRSAPLGRMVVVRREVDGHTYDAVYGHLDPTAPLPSGPVDTSDAIGRFGASVTSGTSCSGSDGGPARLYFGILRDATMLTTGEISGGRAVYAEPLVGLGAYDKFTWWKGPATAIDLQNSVGSPTGRWTKKSTKDGASVPFGETVALVATIKDPVPIREVRFTAYYPGWARPNSAANLAGFDEKSTWRILAVCRPPGVQGEPAKTKGCRWDGSATDGVVTFVWDPTVPVNEKPTPWQPLSRVAITETSPDCVPVSLSFDVYDTAGYRVHGPAGSKRIERCRPATDDSGKVVNLQPLQPPTAPGNVRAEYCHRNSDGILAECLSRSYPAGVNLRWQDRSDNEDGFRIYARDLVEGFNEKPINYDCKNGFAVAPENRWTRWSLVDTTGPDSMRWSGRSRRGWDRDVISIDVQFAVAPFNDAGEAWSAPIGVPGGVCAEVGPRGPDIDGPD